MRNIEKKLSVFAKFLEGENLAVAVESCSKDDDSGYIAGLEELSRLSNCVPPVEGMVYRMPDEGGAVVVDFATTKPDATADDRKLLYNKVAVAAMFAGFRVEVRGGDEPYEIRLRC